jgi:hypothetical protein
LGWFSRHNIVEVKKVIHHKAEFLNKPGFHSDASILTCISVEQESDYPYWNAELRIRDCNDVVSMNCSLEDTDDLENLLNKIEIMINNLKEFKKKLPIGFAEYMQLKANYEKNKK